MRAALIDLALLPHKSSVPADAQRDGSKADAGERHQQDDVQEERQNPLTVVEEHQARNQQHRRQAHPRQDIVAHSQRL